MNDLERKEYQRERKRKSRQKLSTGHKKLRTPRWLQVKLAKEKLKGKKVMLEIEKRRTELDELDEVQIFGKIYKKQDIRINGLFLEVEGIFPKVQYNLSEIQERLKGDSQLMSLIFTLAEKKDKSSSD